MITHLINRAELPPDFGEEDLPLTLRFGGHRATLRFLQADDTGRLIEFFASHTSQTIYERYGYFFTHMSPDHAARLVSVDQRRDAALGVFEERDETLKLIAIGRYCLTPDTRSAELAFVVREDRRELGVASALLHALRIIARDRGLDRLVAQVAHDNPPMLAVFRRAGATFTALEGTSALRVTLPLQSPDPTSRQPAKRRRAPRRKPWLRTASARAALELERATEWLQKLPTP